MSRQKGSICPRLTRRQLLELWLAGMTTQMTAACAATEHMDKSTVMARDNWQEQDSSLAEKGRLLARPKRPPETAKLGLQPLGLDGKRDGLLYIPGSYQASRPAPMVVMLHGAGGDARGGLSPFLHLADAAGLILLAPNSRRQTWDIILDRSGPDISFIDKALEQTFNRYAVDPTRIAIEGFSDGASYVLSVGLTNGDLFTHAIAFSPNTSRLRGKG